MGYSSKVGNFRLVTGKKISHKITGASPKDKDIILFTIAVICSFRRHRSFLGESLFS